MAVLPLRVHRWEPKSGTVIVVRAEVRNTWDDASTPQALRDREE
ncbi:MAG: hypothetical protein QW067_09960 [Thermofilaceae archaeon]